MIEYESLGHINIVVDNIEKATEFYEKALRAVPIQEFPHFKNLGFAKSAGFLDNPGEVEVSIKFLRIPTKEGLFLELMQYHNPTGVLFSTNKETNSLGCVGHITLRVKNIEESFNYLKTIDGVKMINESPEYQPFKIDDITPEQFKFYDIEMENSIEEKKKVCQTVGGIRYFYFLDPYGVQWELEQGHTDIGS
ncbi:MAG: VOC family protein [Cyanobacteria bacterium J06592_8]